MRPPFQCVGWFFGDEDCQPPEADKAWISIQDADGDELAVVVCRDYELTKLEYPERVFAKIEAAHLIVAALNSHRGS